jgi:hypothetical protein
VTMSLQRSADSEHLKKKQCSKLLRTFIVRRRRQASNLNMALTVIRMQQLLLKRMHDILTRLQYMHAHCTRTLYTPYC